MPINFATGQTGQTTTVAASTKIPGIYSGSFQAPGYLVTWTDTPDYTDFVFAATSITASSGRRRRRRDITVSGVSNMYLALGLSGDRKMGDDDVIACIIAGNNGSVEHYYNYGKSPSRLNDTNPSIGITNANIVYNGTALVCSFRRSKSTFGLSNYFNLNNNYYLLIAQGPVQSCK